MNRSMDMGPGMARVAFAIGDPARAMMLASLMDGRSRTAGELARVAGVTPQTASTHLARLVESQLVVIERQGRHRYHRIASSDVAAVVESLMVVAPVQKPALLGPRDAALRRARTCYDHMAGEIALSVAEHCVSRGWIGNDTSLTEYGRRKLAEMGASVPDPTLHRDQVRWCMDWSERRPHVAGQLGKSLLDLFLAQGWVKRQADTRALLVTGSGLDALTARFGRSRD